jgi:hypothetical protein
MVLMTFVLTACVDESGGKKNRDVALYISNQSGYIIQSAFVSETAEEDWGSDELDNAILLSGISIYLEDLNCNRKFDFKVKFAIGVELEKFDQYIYCNQSIIWKVESLTEMSITGN